MGSPRQDITAYAFYETAESPGEVLVRSVNQPAAVIVQAQGERRLLVASVPDIGWQFDKDEIVSRGLGYASEHFASEEASEHTLRLVLRGTWCFEEMEAPLGTGSIALFGQALLQPQCRDGLGTELLLRPCGSYTQ